MMVDHVSHMWTVLLLTVKVVVYFILLASNVCLFCVQWSCSTGSVDSPSKCAKVNVL